MPGARLRQPHTQSIATPVKPRTILIEAVGARLDHGNPPARTPWPAIRDPQCNGRWSRATDERRLTHRTRFLAAVAPRSRQLAELPQSPPGRGIGVFGRLTLRTPQSLGDFLVKLSLMIVVMAECRVDLSQREVRMLVMHLLGTPSVGQMVEHDLNHLHVRVVDPCAPGGVDSDVRCNSCVWHGVKLAVQRGSVNRQGDGCGMCLESGAGIAPAYAVLQTDARADRPTG